MVGDLHDRSQIYYSRLQARTCFSVYEALLLSDLRQVQIFVEDKD